METDSVIALDLTVAFLQTRLFDQNNAQDNNIVSASEEVLHAATSFWGHKIDPSRVKLRFAITYHIQSLHSNVFT